MENASELLTSTIWHRIWLNCTDSQYVLSSSLALWLTKGIYWWTCTWSWFEPITPASVTTVFATSALFLVKHDFAVNRHKRKLGCKKKWKNDFLWFFTRPYYTQMIPDSHFLPVHPVASCLQLCLWCYSQQSM